MLQDDEDRFLPPKIVSNRWIIGILEKLFPNVWSISATNLGEFHPPKRAGRIRNAKKNVLLQVGQIVKSTQSLQYVKFQKKEQPNDLKECVTLIFPESPAPCVAKHVLIPNGHFLACSFT